MKPKRVTDVVKMIPQEPLWKLAQASGPYVRLAALSGAGAVILGAYGSHSKYLLQILAIIKVSDIYIEIQTNFLLFRSLP